MVLSFSHFHTYISSIQVVHLYLDFPTIRTRKGVLYGNINTCVISFLLNNFHFNGSVNERRVRNS